MGKEFTDEEIERLIHGLLESDEQFVRRILAGASEKEKDAYFAEFPEYLKYRAMIDGEK